MKTRLFLLLFALTATTLHAQHDMDGIPYHNMGYEYFTIENLMQQRDGDMFSCTYIAHCETPASEPISLGHLFHKVSPTTLHITDSLFVADTLPPHYLFAKDPRGDGNIRANFEYDADKDSTFLRISRFTDDSFMIDPDEDVVAPVCEGQALTYIYSYLLDCRGDLIMKYYKEVPEGNYECHITRFGIDGTLKHEAILPQSQNFMTNMAVFSESPLRYYQWKRSGGSNLTCYVLDSAFNTVTNAVINKIIHEQSLTDSVYLFEYVYFEFTNHAQVIPDGEDILIASEYTIDTNFYPMTAEHGMAVARYDLRTMQRKNLILFDDLPGWSAHGECHGMQMMSDGAIYLVYTEGDAATNFNQKVTYAVKMDHDFNVEWKRYCKFLENVRLLTNFCIPIKDDEGHEGMAIMGQSVIIDDENEYGSGFFYIFLYHDGTVGVSEGDMGVILVRPYAFYPNPAQDQLRMEFSPDVQPTMVELYDLQGRLVRTQGHAFEHIDISQLPAGIYTVHVTMQDGQVFSDTVVKE